MWFLHRHHLEWSIKSECLFRRRWLSLRASDWSLFITRPKCCMTRSAIRNLPRIFHRAWIVSLLPSSPALTVSNTSLLMSCEAMDFQTFHWLHLLARRFCLVPPAGWKQMGGVTEENVCQYLNSFKHLPHNLSKCLWSWFCKGPNSAAADFNKHFFLIYNNSWRTVSSVTESV